MASGTILTLAYWQVCSDQIPHSLALGSWLQVKTPLISYNNPAPWTIAEFIYVGCKEICYSIAFVYFIYYGQRWTFSTCQEMKIWFWRSEKDTNTHCLLHKKNRNMDKWRKICGAEDPKQNKIKDDFFSLTCYQRDTIKKTILIQSSEEQGRKRNEGCIDYNRIWYRAAMILLALESWPLEEWHLMKVRWF